MSHIIVARRCLGDGRCQQYWLRLLGLVLQATGETWAGDSQKQGGCNKHSA